MKPTDLTIAHVHQTAAFLQNCGLSVYQGYVVNFAILGGFVEIDHGAIYYDLDELKSMDGHPRYQENIVAMISSLLHEAGRLIILPEHVRPLIHTDTDLEEDFPTLILPTGYPLQTIQQYELATSAWSGYAATALGFPLEIVFDHMAERRTEGKAERLRFEHDSHEGIQLLRLVTPIPGVASLMDAGQAMVA
jgi:hypothetical protein